MTSLIDWMDASLPFVELPIVECMPSVTFFFGWATRMGFCFSSRFYFKP